MEILAIIPARRGSKGIPHKNLRLLLGRPMIEYTFDAALQSSKVTRIVLTTDDPDVAQLAARHKVEVPFSRPAELAADDTPMLPVLEHSLSWLKANNDYVPDVVVLLQPTSPLRTANHVDDAVDLLLSRDTDSVVTVIEVPHHFNPVSVMRIEADCLVPYLEGPTVLSRHEKPKVFARNGPAVLAVHTRIIVSGSLYGRRTIPLEMSRGDSVDVDDMDDFKLAEFRLLQRKRLTTGNSSSDESR